MIASCIDYRYCTLCESIFNAEMKWYSCFLNHYIFRIGPLHTKHIRSKMTFQLCNSVAIKLYTIHIVCTAYVLQVYHRLNQVLKRKLRQNYNFIQTSKLNYLVLFKK